MAITIQNRLGQIAGWNEVTVRILGRDLVGIVKVAYADDFDDEYLKGAGNNHVGYAKGENSPTASIDLYQEEVNNIIAALPSGKKMRDIDPFDMVVTYSYDDRTVTDIVKGCRFKGSSKEIGQGDKGVIKSFPLNTYEIQENVR